MKKYSNLFLIIVFSLAFGLAGGFFGSLFSRIYNLEKAFNMPLVGDINLKDNDANQSLVIRSAKNVIVEQNTKVRETLFAGQKSLAGIYRAATSTPATAKSGQADYARLFSSAYELKKELAQGLIITSDGWILSTHIPEQLSGAIATSAKQKLLSEYVIITADKAIYPVSDIIADKERGIAFWRARASDLAVRPFADTASAGGGELVLAANWDGDAHLSTVISHAKPSGSLRSSDRFESELLLAGKPGDNFRGSFVFNLNGEALAFIDNGGKIRPFTGIMPCLRCLLMKIPIKYPQLGANYLDLSQFVSDSKDLPRKGALLAADASETAVKKGSGAERAGLRAGDVIISVNGQELDENKDLSQAISSFSSGETVAIRYLRSGKENSVEIKL